ncbi:MAG: glycosyltransferase [Nocardioidaceae bacterium]|nr:glycosyltransferase [Nocardioidaceae bacterium]
MRLEVVAVVVPARDEQETIGACLASVAVAARQVRLDVRTVVVADSCVDATAQVATAAGAKVIKTTGSPGGGVGAARAAGCAYALRTLEALPPAAIWLAHTDADSVVPPDWLRAQLAYAERGYDAVVGMVTLAGNSDSDAHRRWTSAYRQRHGHVHGANLGVRGDAYLAVGGFAAVSAHEDLGLLERLVAVGRVVARPHHPRVVTSARLVGRTPAGVAADLRALHCCADRLVNSTDTRTQTLSGE